MPISTISPSQTHHQHSDVTSASGALRERRGGGWRHAFDAPCREIKLLISLPRFGPSLGSLADSAMHLLTLHRDAL
jgi:hypothetical protein